MLSLAEFTVLLGRLLEMLKNYPETRQAVVAELKEWGLVMEPAWENDVDIGNDDPACRGGV